ncbi:MAG: hypothetical protein QM778_34730 [Myxococcales bacterium]
MSTRAPALALCLGLLTTGGCIATDGSEGDDEVHEQSSALHTTADYKDPGMNPWTPADARADCRLDVSKLEAADIANLAIFRYGKQCYMKGSDGVGSLYSATKTLGGLMVGRAAYLTQDIQRSGSGTGTILPEDKATDWLGSVNYSPFARLTHVMSMSADNLIPGSDFEYDTFGNVQINTLIDVTKKAIGQIPTLGTDASDFVQRELFNKLGMTNSSWLPAPFGIAGGWFGNMSDMGRLGMLLLHDGWYNGERLVAKEWVYRMSHPAFEYANTSYGHLMWLNHRGNAQGAGGNVFNPPSDAEAKKWKNGDPCAPAAFWQSYPHGVSPARDCRAALAGTSCVQQYDVGVYSAQGAGGQFIVMHPGLDLVIVAKNYNVEYGPFNLWEKVRPAVIALDPVYKDRPDAFCAAYGAGNYAPDLVLPRGP